MSKKIDLSLDKICDDYFEYVSKRHKYQGFNTLARNFKNHIYPFLNDNVRDISKITKKDILLWQDMIISKNFSNSFNNALYCNFSSFINYCISCDYLEFNVVKAVGNFKKKNEVPKYDYYTYIEFCRFRRKISNFLIKQFFNFMFFYGTRPSEAMALRFCDIHGNYISICHSLQRRGKRKLDTPKTQSSIRELKLSLICRFRFYVLKCYYIKHYGSCPDSYYVFGGKKPLSTTTIDRYKKSACQKANIREITQHQFRHSYATRMIHNHKPIEDVSKSLGHSRTSMTVDVYLHSKKKRMHKSISLSNLIFFKALARNFKKILQSIITLFLA